MNKEQVQGWINEGYAILKSGVPTKVEGDIWAYLDTLDEEDMSVLVLDDLIKWSNEDLAELQRCFS